MSFSLKPIEKSYQWLSDSQSGFNPTVKSQELHKEGVNISKNGIGKSEYLSGESQLKMLMESIKKLEAEIREREMYYGRTVEQLTDQLQLKAEENQGIKAEIRQLAGQAREIKKQTKNLLMEYNGNGGRPVLQKSVSTKSIVENRKMEHVTEISRQSPFPKRSTQKNIKHMF